MSQSSTSGNDRILLQKRELHVLECSSEVVLRARRVLADLDRELFRQDDFFYNPNSFPVRSFVRELETVPWHDICSPS